MTAPFDVTKLLPALLPQEYDGKNAQEDLHLYHQCQSLLAAMRLRAITMAYVKLCEV